MALSKKEYLQPGKGPAVLISRSLSKKVTAGGQESRRPAALFGLARNGEVFDERSRDEEES